MHGRIIQAGQDDAGLQVEQIHDEAQEQVIQTVHKAGSYMMQHTGILYRMRRERNMQKLAAAAAIALVCALFLTCGTGRAADLATSKRVFVSNSTTSTVNGTIDSQRYYHTFLGETDGTAGSVTIYVQADGRSSNGTLFTSNTQNSTKTITLKTPNPAEITGFYTGFGLYCNGCNGQWRVWLLEQ